MPAEFPTLTDLVQEEQILLESATKDLVDNSSPTLLQSDQDLNKIIPEPLPSALNNDLGSTSVAVSLTATNNSVFIGTTASSSQTSLKYPYFRPLYLIEGTPKSDYLTDTPNNDLILARGGDDYVIAWRGGNDQIYGEEGNDFLYAGAGDDNVYGGNGNDRIYGSSGNDYLYGDSIYYYYYPYATLSADALNTTASVNSSVFKPYPYPSWGDDSIYGGTGRDYIYGGGGNDSIDGGSDNDVIYGDSGSNYYSYSYTNVWYPDPYAYFVGGNDTLKGGSGNDIISGEDGNDSLDGGSGNDSLYGGSGNDSLYGQSGNNYLDGGNGDDKIQGGDGNDTIVGSRANYFFNYLDTRILSTTDTPLQTDAQSTNNNFNITATFATTNNLKSDLADIFIDRPILFSDQDVLTGGKEADKFVFYNRYNGVDTITDFNRDQGDQIQIDRFGFGSGFTISPLSPLVATSDVFTPVVSELTISSGLTKGGSGLTPGILKEEQFTLGISAGDANDRFIYNDKTGDLFFDIDGNGSQGQVKFAQLSGAPNLTYKDIFII